MHGRSRRARSLTVVGRIVPDVTAQQAPTFAKATVGRQQEAQRELDVISARIANDYKDSNAGWGARVVAAHDQLVGASRPALMVLMGAVGFLLLIVCANMANLLLARLSSRRREMAVRGALGASRWEVARPVLAESLLLSVGGGTLGSSGHRRIALLGSMEGAAAADGSDPTRWRRVAVHHDRVDRRGARVRIAAGAHASRQDLREQCRSHRRNQDLSPGDFERTRGRRSCARAGAVVGAGLMTRSFTKLLQVSPGFDSTNLVAAACCCRPQNINAPTRCASMKMRSSA